LKSTRFKSTSRYFLTTQNEERSDESASSQVLYCGFEIEKREYSERFAWFKSTSRYILSLTRSWATDS